MSIKKKIFRSLLLSVIICTLTFLVGCGVSDPNDDNGDNGDNTNVPTQMALGIYGGLDNDGKIVRYNTSTKQIEDIAVSTAPYGIAIDASNDHLYWTDRSSARIYRSNLDGSAMTTLISSGLNNPAAIALDLTNNKIYWTDVGNITIKRANLDGSAIETLVDAADSIEDPLGLVLDIANNYMYFTDTTRKKISRSDLDGNSITTLVSDLPGPHGIVLDSVNAKLYWINWVNDSTIQRCDLDGSNLETFVTGLTDGMGVMIENGYLYWTHIGTPTLQCKSLSGGNVIDIIAFGHAPYIAYY